MAPPGRVCKACKTMRPRIEYSNKQWDNGTSRRCKVCVGNGTPVDHGSDKYGQLPAPPKTGIREAQALASRQVIWTEMLAQVEEMLGHGKDVLKEWEQQQALGHWIDCGKRELRCLQQIGNQLQRPGKVPEWCPICPQHNKSLKSIKGMMNHFRENDDHDTLCEDLCAPFWVDVPVNVQQFNVQVNAQQETDSGGSEDEEEFDSEEEEGSINPYDPNGAY
jgi:hypothetical protein